MKRLKRKSWHNATQADLDAIDKLISDKTTQLNEASTLLSQALTAINSCNNEARPNGLFGSTCLDITGRHISTWREQRDTYSPLVDRYKKELLDLQSRRAALVNEINASAQLLQTVSQTNVVTAQAQQAIAAADTVQTIEKTKKWGIYVGIGLGVIALMIGTIILYKKFKK